MRLAVSPLLVALLFSVSARAETVTSPVGATEGRRCTAILRVPEGAAKLPLILVMQGSGVYSNVDDRAVSFWGHFLTERKAALLMFDKPGIGFAEGKATVDDATYNHYVAEDLVACARNALAWAASQESAHLNGKVVVAGHSEGSMTAIRLLQKLSQEKSPALGSIRLALLSGVPLGKWETILEPQLSVAERATLKKALATKDDAAARKLTSVGVAYLKNASKAEPCGAVLEALAESGLQTNVQIFQGLEDHNASASAVRDLDRWNSQREEAGKPALRLSARFYEAGHGLNLAAVNDMLLITEALMD